jgi:YidC/Oxa1 family membrane protein insertase
MDNQRVFLWIALAVMVWLNYTAFLQDQRPASVPPAQSSDPLSAPELREEAAPPSLPQLQDAGADVPAPPGGAVATAVPGPAEAAPAAERRIRVSTDVLELEISLRGGDLVQAVLPEYPVHKNAPDIPVQLLDPAPDALYVFRSGLTARAPGASTRTDTLFTAPAMEFTLAPGEDVLEVPLTARLDNGKSVTKT